MMGHKKCFFWGEIGIIIPKLSQFFLSGVLEKRNNHHFSYFFPKKHDCIILRDFAIIMLTESHNMLY